ncbi:MAG: hypothetical protein CSA29_01915 [Desulfobacterales bacterium]|nr:MAG: hypothetical protein CSA29_01915 [Desulfobacterales bacterium]
MDMCLPVFLDISQCKGTTPCRFQFDAYDLALKVGKQGRRATFENALSHIAPFGLDEKAAMSIVSEIKAIFSGWQNHFKEMGVTLKDMDKLSRRFSHSGFRFDAFT